MRKTGLALLVGILLFLLWYFFVKHGEYQVNFTTGTTPGDIIQTVRIWNRSLRDATILSVDSLKGLTQEIEKDGQKYIFEWSFKDADNSKTKTSIVISEPGHGFLNKLLVPFSEPPIEKTANKLSHDIYNVIKEHLEITDVEIVGMAEFESKFCVCTSLETDQSGKAYGMMKDYGLLTSFIADHGIEVSDKPIVDVTSWDHNEGSLTFDFCFPVVKTDSLPSSELVNYKTIQGFKAVKAVYKGNYITSDRAWYELQVYAQQHDLAIAGFPKEVFYNNPNLGVDEEKWRAEIFIPIKEKPTEE